MTPDEAAFEARAEEDGKRIRRYHDSLAEDDDPAGPDNPEHRLAPEYFRIYLQHHPSRLAARALGLAFRMWGNLEASAQVREVVAQIPHDEDVWGDQAVNGVFYALWKDGFDAALAQLEQLSQRVTPDPSRAMILHTLSRRRMQIGEKEKARQGFETILQLDTRTCPWYVEPNARGCLYELDCLNPGQPAPVFTAVDLDGGTVSLGDYRGRVVLLDFWASWCGPCHAEFAHVRSLAAKYPSDSFVLIGISLDEDLDQLRRCVSEERLDWPHICEGGCWQDPLAKLYNIGGIPQTYVVGRDGLIVAKDLRGEALEETLDGLLK